MGKQSVISKKLLLWHETIDRNLPWKSSNDPYKIWLSEIILQQTRVAQGLPYYEKFVQRYPTIKELAAAPQDDIMNMWQGLGYYSRARNMHHTAKTVANEFDGVFPTDYKDVLSLKGVGNYTAAAIVSFAYGQSYPVVDGNVLRVISRLHGITDPIDDSKTIKSIYALSEAYIKGADPALYNQAIMDLGALVCTPKNPTCEECPFTEECLARKKELISAIPYKAKKIKKTTRHLHYFYLVDKIESTVIKHRKGKDIWQGLYDMPCLEMKAKGPLDNDAVQEYLHETLGLASIKMLSVSDTYKHILSHQTLFINFYKIETDQLPKVEAPFHIISTTDITNYGMPIVIANYLKEN